ELVEPVLVQEQRSVLREKAEGGVRLVEPVLDVLHLGQLADLLRETVRQLLVLLRLPFLGCFEHDQQVVQAAEVLQRTDEGGDLRVVAWKHGEDVGIELEPAAQKRRADDSKRGDEKDQPPAAPGEVLDSYQDSAMNHEEGRRL